jgi:hypothetical protein
MLFNWFKKKDKLVPTELTDSGPKQINPGIAAHGKPAHKTLGRPGANKKTAHPIKDLTNVNTSESSVIRIGKLGEVLLQYLRKRLSKSENCWAKFS